MTGHLWATNDESSCLRYPLTIMPDEYEWGGWTDWTPLESLDLKTVSSGPGAYIIAANRPLQRAVSVDPYGFLTIGESGSLRRRFKDFIRCASTRHQEGHMAGWRYAFFRFHRHYPLATLGVRWIEADDKGEAYRAEGRVMFDYLKRHAELPPLNYKFNWTMFKELGWDVFDDPDSLK